MCDGIIRTQLRVEENLNDKILGTKNLETQKLGTEKIEARLAFVEVLAGFLFLQFTLKGMFGAMPGFGKIAVGAVLHGIGITVAELALHGIVTALVTFVRLLGALAAVGIIEKMIAGALCHIRPFRGFLLISADGRLR
jgi:hypothetical protein